MDQISHVIVCFESNARVATIVVYMVFPLKYLLHVIQRNTFALYHDQFITICTFHPYWSLLYHNTSFTEVSCGDPGVGNFSRRDTEGFLYQDKITFICDNGYYIREGVSKIRCMENKQWSHPVPDCESKYFAIVKNFDFFSVC